jgi:Helix-turn-helix of DDE superfamily endonuclease/DDE superfamily endonuclease
MILRYRNLRQNKVVFKAMTGLRVAEFDELVDDLLPGYTEAEEKRLSRRERKRAIGGGPDFELDARDQILLSVIWLRKYPTYEVLGYLFGISDTTVGRTISRVLPLLEAAGRDSMRLPDPGRKRRRHLDELLKETPELAVIIDTFEQAVQRPQSRAEADPYYSGKKKRHTLKSQVAVDEQSGQIVDVASSTFWSDR